MKAAQPYLALTLATTLLAASSVVCSADGPPVAPVRPVTDTYFGTTVVDNYRYMENLRDPEVQSWMKAQAAYTRKVLDAIPGQSCHGQTHRGTDGQGFAAL